MKDDEIKILSIKRHNTACLGLVLISLIMASPVSFGWEEDFHYGLTRWLALQAGLLPALAEQVAQGDLDCDRSIADAVFLVSTRLHVLAGEDRVASELVRDLHFPTDGPIPGEPVSRTVFPGSPAAYRRVNQELAIPANALSGQRSLRDFGKALHALQDSWSHGGEPMISLGLHKDTAWGHPCLRGGCYLHDADLTHMEFPDFQKPNATNRLAALEAARSTYEQLKEFTRKNPWARDKSHRTAEWAKDVEPAANTFCQASNKSMKIKWFATNGFENFEFVANTSYPGGKSNVKDRIAQIVSATDYSVKTAHEFFSEFFIDWKENGTKSVVNKLVDKAEFNRRFNAAHGFENPLPMNAVWPAELLLNMWLVSDHGKLNALGHAAPLNNCERIGHPGLKPKSDTGSIYSKRRAFASRNVTESKGAPPSVETSNEQSSESQSIPENLMPLWDYVSESVGRLKATEPGEKRGEAQETWTRRIDSLLSFGDLIQKTNFCILPAPVLKVSDDPEAVVALIRFNNSPKDIVMFFAERPNGGAFKLVNVSWIIAH